MGFVVCDANWAIYGLSFVIFILLFLVQKRFIVIVEMARECTHNVLKGFGNVSEKHTSHKQVQSTTVLLKM